MAFHGQAQAGLQGCGAIQDNLQPPIAGTQLPSETQGSQRAGSPCQHPPQATSGHLSMRVVKIGALCVECLGVGDITSPSSRQKVLAGQSQLPCQPYQHSEELAEPLRYTSPPLALLQALAVSDHYPVEVKLMA